MFRFVPVLVLAAFLCSVVYADTIVLKNGGKLHGKIESENEKEVVINISNMGTITVRRNRIKKILRDERTGPAPPGQEAPVERPGKGSADTDELMKKFFAASTDKEVRDAINLIRSSRANPLDIEKQLRAGREYSRKVKTGWQVLYNKGTDGKKRPYHLYVPRSYDPARKYPVFYDLHGGVFGEISPAREMIGRREYWEPFAEKAGFILIFPHGETSASWYNKVGTDNLLSQLDHVKRNYNVDENKVFLSGFSDGGSGSFWMAFHWPTKWAGFISLSGSITVPKRGPYQCYPRNLLNRPIHIAHGGKDKLYPLASMRKYVEQLNKLGADIELNEYPRSAHDMSYYPAEMPQVVGLVRKTARSSMPSHITWETADTQVGRCDWARIDEIRDVGNNKGFKDLNLMVQVSGQSGKSRRVPLYRRKKTTGSIEVKARGNRIEVTVRNVAKYTLFINSKQFDLGKRLHVVTNGQTTYNYGVSRDLVFMLKQAAKDNDRSTVYCAKIEIAVPTK